MQATIRSISGKGLPPEVVEGSEVSVDSLEELIQLMKITNESLIVGLKDGKLKIEIYDDYAE